MEQYISKSALVAEIERLKECNRKICAGDFDFLRKTYPEHYYSTEIYNSILSFLDTLEVIEIGVDLGDPKGDKSAEYIIDTKTLEVKEVDLDYIKKELDELIRIHKPNGDFGWGTLYNVATHFFELGLKASNSITEVNLESLVRQVIGLYLEAGKHYNSVIEEERKEYGGSDLAIKLFDGVIDAKELSIQYVLDKLKAQKG